MPDREGGAALNEEAAMSVVASVRRSMVDGLGWLETISDVIDCGEYELGKEFFPGRELRC